MVKAVETTLYDRRFNHGFVTVEHDSDEPNGLYIQAAAHAATGFAFVPDAELGSLALAILRHLRAKAVHFDDAGATIQMENGAIEAHWWWTAPPPLSGMRVELVEESTK